MLRIVVVPMSSWLYANEPELTAMRIRMAVFVGKKMYITESVRHQDTLPLLAHLIESNYHQDIEIIAQGGYPHCDDIFLVPQIRAICNRTGTSPSDAAFLTLKFKSWKYENGSAVFNSTRDVRILDEHLNLIEEFDAKLSNEAVKEFSQVLDLHPGKIYWAIPQGNLFEQMNMQNIGRLAGCEVLIETCKGDHSRDYPRERDLDDKSFKYSQKCPEDVLELTYPMESGEYDLDEELVYEKLRLYNRKGPSRFRFQEFMKTPSLIPYEFIPGIKIRKSIHFTLGEQE